MIMKMQTFRKCFLIMKIQSQESHLVHFIIVLRNHMILLQENIYLPSVHEIFVLKNVFDQNLLCLLIDFQNICCTFFNKLNSPLCQEKNSSIFKQLLLRKTINRHKQTRLSVCIVQIAKWRFHFSTNIM